MSSAFPRLLADIGGTNARFALETAPGVIGEVAVLPSHDYPSLEEALRAYLLRAGQPPLAHAALGIANPVTGDHVQMTNHHWGFSIAALRDAFGLKTLLVLNDFTVLALSLPHLPAADLDQVGGGAARPGAKALLGPGTGLGMSGLVPAGSGWVALAGEGGHASFAPATAEEYALLDFARRQVGEHVSWERLLTGSGLELIDRFFAHQAGEDTHRPAPEISAAGLAGTCPRAHATLTLFCALLGTAAANLALTLGAVGGVYIGGGIVPRFGDFMKHSPFRARFEAKGRLSAYTAALPVYVIRSAMPALIGASAALAAELDRPNA